MLQESFDKWDSAGKGSVFMNSLRKIYCRGFQAVFKAALPFLPYRKPRIVNSVKALPEVIQKKKCTKVLIITDEGIRKLGLTSRLEKALENAQIPYCIYDKTVANPTTDNVSEASAADPAWTAPRQQAPVSLSQNSLWPK